MHRRRPKYSGEKTRSSVITRPAVLSVAIATAIEIPLYNILAIFGCKPFVLFLTSQRLFLKSHVASNRLASSFLVNNPLLRPLTNSRCYLLYAISTQLAMVLLATRPLWYGALVLKAHDVNKQPLEPQELFIPLCPRKALHLIPSPGLPDPQ